MSEKFTDKIDKVISIIIKAIVFLLPLFFLPWTNEFFEFNKQLLLRLLAPLAALLWLYGAAARGRLIIKINPLNLPVLIFLALSAAAAVFSLDRFSSFFGYFGRFSDGWLGLLSLALFYFLIVNAGPAANQEKITGLIKLFLYSSLTAAAITLFCLLSGFKSGASFWSWFNPAGGSPAAGGIFLAVSAVLAANFLTGRGRLLKNERIFFGAGLIMVLAILTLVNHSLSWALMFFGAGLIAFFRFRSGDFSFKKAGERRRWLLAGLILMSVFFLAGPKLNAARIFLGREAPREVALDYGAALKIAGETVKKYPALGSGPGTFALDFSLYRPAEFNNGEFWQIRFDKSAANFLELTATAGLLTLLSYFLIISLAIYLNAALIGKFLRKLAADFPEQDYELITGLFTVFILIFSAGFFSPTNTVLNFIFWFSLALITSFWQARDQVLFKEKIIDLRRTRRFYRLTLAGLVVLSLGAAALLIFEVRFFSADLLAARKTDRQANLTAAVKLNPYQPNYRVSLAKLYLNQARQEALKPAGQRNDLEIRSAISLAVAAARRAEIIAPNSVLASETMGMIYRDIRLLTSGSEPWAVKSFSRAFSLEPTNPILAAELAKAYANDGEPALAELYFKKALELKSDYFAAKFGLAKIFMNGRQDNQALTILNELASQSATAEVYYELGRYYFNHGETEQAISRFKLALSLAPDHSNSLYSLAVIYETRGNFKEALYYYRRVLALNPANAEVEKKVERLSK